MFSPPPPAPCIVSVPLVQALGVILQPDFPHVPPTPRPASLPLACPPPTGQIPPQPRPVAPVVIPAPVAPVRATLSPAGRRKKGQRGERQVIDLLQAVVDAARIKYSLEPLVLQRNTIQADMGGHDIHGLTGFSIEVKWQESGFSSAWWKQCLAQAGSRNVPILFWRASHQPWKVMMRVFANTPRDRDQVELDVSITLEDFLLWWADAYDEACVEELQREGH